MESYIIPLHKSGNKNSNYRGIAKLSSISKLFEQILTNQLKFVIPQIISPHQHGFLKHRSVETNLFEFVVKIFNFFSVGLTDLNYTDFSKAFDRVNHCLLLKKLQLLGFNPKLLEWICSYLSGRFQKVVFNNELFDTLKVTSR